MLIFEKFYRQDFEFMLFRQLVDLVMLNIFVSFFYDKFLLSSLKKKRIYILDFCLLVFVCWFLSSFIINIYYFDVFCEGFVYKWNIFILGLF